MTAVNKPLEILDLEQEGPKAGEVRVEVKAAGVCMSDLYIFFFFKDTATTEIYTLSLHDALPISRLTGFGATACTTAETCSRVEMPGRSEEHTSELQSRGHLVCRLLLEKKK